MMRLLDCDVHYLAANTHDVGAALHIECLLINARSLSYHASVGCQYGHISTLGVADHQQSTASLDRQLALSHLFHTGQDTGLVAEGRFTLVVNHRDGVDVGVVACIDKGRSVGIGRTNLFAIAVNVEA